MINAVTGAVQEVLHVDNTAAGGGDGSAENPFNTLADAEVAASEHTIIYVRQGDGTSANQDQGITLNQRGQQLIGSGTNFLYDNGRFTTASGASPSSFIIAPATDAPVIGNVNAGQDGVTISADDIIVSGVTVDNATTGQDGIKVIADGAGASAQNVTIQNVTTRNSRHGIYIHGTNDGTVSAMVQNVVTTLNSQHGIAVYDDTNSTFTADLGGGTLGSTGNNVLAGNMLEDLAVEYDGRALSAQNNWWGQASGPDMDTPDIGINPQIYYGAPMNDGLVGHWTFDTEWTTNTTAYDRSGNTNDGSLEGGLSLADQVTGQNRQALDFDGGNDMVLVNNSPSLNPVTGFTYYMQARKEGAGSADPRAIIISRNGNYIDINFSGQPLFSYRRPGQTLLSGGVASGIGVWTNYTASYDGSTASLFTDNTLVGSENLAGTLSVLGDLTIGEFDGSGFNFNGLVDDTRIYSRVLDPSEISELNRMDTSSSVNISGFLSSAP